MAQLATTNSYNVHIGGDVFVMGTLCLSSVLSLTAFAHILLATAGLVLPLASPLLAAMEFLAVLLT